MDSIVQKQTPSKEERTWATAIHLAALCGFIFPLGNVIGPLIIWLLKREVGTFVDCSGKAALNFALSVTLYTIASFLLIFLVIGFFLLAALVVFWLICVIIAAVKANEGSEYRFPLCIRFLK